MQDLNPPVQPDILWFACRPIFYMDRTSGASGSGSTGRTGWSDPILITVLPCCLRTPLHYGLFFILEKICVSSALSFKVEKSKVQSSYKIDIT